jgi:hypothetical protein
MKPRKGGRVDMDPNTAFASIEQIRRVQEVAEAVEIEPVDKSEDGESSDAGSCIEDAAIRI